jgi:hypothetical protein
LAAGAPGTPEPDDASRLRSRALRPTGRWAEGSEPHRDPRSFAASQRETSAGAIRICALGPWPMCPTRRSPAAAARRTVVGWQRTIAATSSTVRSVALDCASSCFTGEILPQDGVPNRVPNCANRSELSATQRHEGSVTERTVTHGRGLLSRWPQVRILAGALRRTPHKYEQRALGASARDGRARSELAGGQRLRR